MQSFQVLCVLLALAAPAASLKTTAALKLKNDERLDFMERPVMQVIRLLQDTKEELQTELKDDEEVHEMLRCWCIDNKKEKGQAIAVGKAMKAKLEALIDKLTSKLAFLKQKREETYQELQDDVKSLQEAREIRMKDNREFRKQENDLIEAIKASGGAITVLKSQQNPDLAQMRSATERLLQLSAVQHAQGDTKQNAQTLASLLQGSHGAAAFLQSPGYQSYAPQSSQVFGILEQMKEDFEESLKELRDAEAKAVQEFEDMKAAKDKEIALGNKEIVTLDAAIADSMEKKAAAEKQLSETVKQLQMDLEFMTKLLAKCKKDADTYDDRVKSRMEEISAMEDAISILNSEDAFTVFDNMAKVEANNPMNPGLDFIQTSSKRSQDRTRQRAQVVLQEAAARSGNALLASLAGKVRIDAFTEVKAEIDKMVAELKKQQAQEVKFKDQCVADQRMNVRQQAAEKDSLEASTAKKEVLEKDMEELQEAMDAETKEIGETQAAMKKKSETREAEYAAVSQTIQDHRLMSRILQKAIDRLKQVYVLLEQQPGAPHTQTSATHTDPGNGPARFKTYQAGKGGKIVAMLENILEHTKKTESMAITDEEDEQQEYETFMKDSNKIVIAAQQAMDNMNEEMAKSKETMATLNGDIDDSKSEIKRLIDSEAALKADCDFYINNFDVRQEARAEEIEALGEAKAILSGAN